MVLNILIEMFKNLALCVIDGAFPNSSRTIFEPVDYVHIFKRKVQESVVWSISLTTTEQF